MDADSRIDFSLSGHRYSHHELQLTTWEQQVANNLLLASNSVSTFSYLPASNLWSVVREPEAAGEAAQLERLAGPHGQVPRGEGQLAVT